jgi:hypothetical protein
LGRDGVGIFGRCCAVLESTTASNHFTDLEQQLLLSLLSITPHIHSLV